MAHKMIDMSDKKKRLYRRRIDNIYVYLNKAMYLCLNRLANNSLYRIILFLAVEVIHLFFKTAASNWTIRISDMMASRNEFGGSLTSY
jgi:hypothetical protein